MSWHKPKPVSGVKTFWTVIKENTFFQLIRKQPLMGMLSFNAEKSYDWKIVIKVRNFKNQSLFIFYCLIKKNKNFYLAHFIKKKKKNSQSKFLIQ